MEFEYFLIKKNKSQNGAKIPSSSFSENISICFVSGIIFYEIILNISFSSFYHIQYCHELLIKNFPFHHQPYQSFYASIYASIPVRRVLQRCHASVSITTIDMVCSISPREPCIMNFNQRRFLVRISNIYESQYIFRRISQQN